MHPLTFRFDRVVTAGRTQGGTFVNNALSGAVSGMFASALLQVQIAILPQMNHVIPRQPLDVLRTRMQQVVLCLHVCLVFACDATAFRGTRLLRIPRTLYKCVARKVRWRARALIRRFKYFISLHFTRNQVAGRCGEACPPPSSASASAAPFIYPR